MFLNFFLASFFFSSYCNKMEWVHLIISVCGNNVCISLPFLFFSSLPLLFFGNCYAPGILASTVTNPSNTFQNFRYLENLKLDSSK